MSTKQPPPVETLAAPEASDRSERELHASLRRAERDFARGDYLELTPAQLERCVTPGASPWPNESPD